MNQLEHYLAGTRQRGSCINGGMMNRRPHAHRLTRSEGGAVAPLGRSISNVLQNQQEHCIPSPWHTDRHNVARDDGDDQNIASLRSSPLDHFNFNFAPAGNNIPYRPRSHRRDRSDRDAVVKNLNDAEQAMPPYRESGDLKALNPDLAVVRIIDWLTSSIGKRKAIQSLELARSFVRQPKPDWRAVPFYIWSTLDNGLFESRLSPAVYLAWTEHYHGNDENEMGQTFAPGMLRGRHGQIERIAIVLNKLFFAARARTRSPSLQRDRNHYTTNGEAGDTLIAVMIHQMIHAWFVRACGQQTKASMADHRLKHGEGFWKLMNCIGDLSKQSDKHFDDSSNSFDHPSFIETMKRVHEPLREDTGLSIPRRIQAQMDEERFDHTICHAMVLKRISKEDADAWYKKASGPAKDATSDNLYSLDPCTNEAKPTARHERGSPLGYIEVNWDRKAFDYKRKGIEKEFLSLRTKLSDGKRIITLPRGLDIGTFKILDSFLKIGTDYKPTLTPRPPIGVVTLATPFKKPESIDVLWADVRAFKLGLAMDFPELIEAARNRLGCRRTISTSPMEALTEIYCSQSMMIPSPVLGGNSSIPCAALEVSNPSDDLRQWARGLMMATRAGSSNRGYYESNLHAIEKYGGAGGVQGLIASTQSTELEQDFAIALTHLWKKTPKSMHPHKGISSGGGFALMNEIPVDLDIFPSKFREGNRSDRVDDICITIEEGRQNRLEDVKSKSRVRDYHADEHQDSFDLADHGCNRSPFHSRSRSRFGRTSRSTSDASEHLKTDLDYLRELSRHDGWSEESFQKAKQVTLNLARQGRRPRFS